MDRDHLAGGVMTSHAVIGAASVVTDGSGRARWVVAASFFDRPSQSPRCIEYRVRAVPDCDTVARSFEVADALATSMEAEVSTDEGPAEGPAEGIPQRVFDEFSQTKMLEDARAQARRRSTSAAPCAKEPQHREGGRKPLGRPPVMPLEMKLTVLQSIETAFASDGTLADVAAEHHMSRSAVRDLLAWARSDDPAAGPLFTKPLPRRRGGGLTPVARELLMRTARI